MSATLMISRVYIKIKNPHELHNATNLANYQSAFRMTHVFYICCTPHMLTTLAHLINMYSLYIL